jgi:hypothetical protein
MSDTVNMVRADNGSKRSGGISGRVGKKTVSQQRGPDLRKLFHEMEVDKLMVGSD